MDLNRKRSKEKCKKALYKTEMCLSFSNTGKCKYGGKCRFAHGEEELRSVAHGSKYKTVKCKQWESEGWCKYGPRCHFIHGEKHPPIIHTWFQIMVAPLPAQVQSTVQPPSGSRLNKWLGGSQSRQ